MAALRDMIGNVAAVAEREVVPLGRFIYAFCNVRTNQVLYSLSRSLDNSALKQLPDLGANHTPPKLRRDLWRPLYQVELPATPDGPKQGLHAFRKLREYRKLHELSWEQTSMMTRNHTDKEIEKEKKKLEGRGGSKKETVYDIIKREKHKMKVKMVMDQKANSIADLAAVLLEQEELGAASQATVNKWRAQVLEKVETLVREAENGGIATMQDSLRAMRKSRIKGQQRELHRKIQESERRLKEMQRAAKIARVAQAEAEKIERVAREGEGGMPETIEKQIAGLEERLQKELPQIPTGKARNELEGELKDKIRRAKEQLNKIQTARETMKAVRARAVPTEEGSPEATFVAAYRREAMSSFSETLETAQHDPKNLPKRGQARREVEPRNLPIYITEGITVKWANIMDAEYAAMWPDAVQHERMGYTTRSPPLIESAEGEVEVAQEKVEGAQETVEGAQEKIEGAQETVEGAQETVEEAQETVEEVQETVEEAAVERSNRLEIIQKDILAEVQKKAAKESWDRHAELDLKRAMNKYKLAPLPADAPVDQQPTI